MPGPGPANLRAFDARAGDYLFGALNGGARSSGQRVSCAPGVVPKTPQTFKLNGVKFVLRS